MIINTKKMIILLNMKNKKKLFLIKYKINIKKKNYIYLKKYLFIKYYYYKYKKISNIFMLNLKMIKFIVLYIFFYLKSIFGFK